jgi:hypothetical protein
MSAPATFETFQLELARLVEKFDRDYPQFVAATYNEATLRSEFLDDYTYMRHWLYIGLKKSRWKYADVLPEEMWAGHPPTRETVVSWKRWRLPHAA